MPTESFCYNDKSRNILSTYYPKHCESKHCNNEFYLLSLLFFSKTRLPSDIKTILITIAQEKLGATKNSSICHYVSILRDTRCRTNGIKHTSSFFTCDTSGSDNIHHYRVFLRIIRIQHWFMRLSAVRI